MAHASNKHQPLSRICFFPSQWPSIGISSLTTMEQQSRHERTQPPSIHHHVRITLQRGKENPTSNIRNPASFSLVTVTVLHSCYHPHAFPLHAQMVKTSVEFCIISGRGLGRRSSLLKPQWFCVAWVDPNSKYCTRVDASGNSDPSWGMKFRVPVDEHDPSSLQRMALTVEVYRREPIFLREHLQGTAVVQMKEYFDKSEQGGEQSAVTEETASFQLRRKKSDKAHGFVDISVRICKEEEDAQTQFAGSDGGSKHPNQVGITLAIENGPVYNYPPLPSSRYRGQSQDDDHYSSNMPTTSTTHQDPTASGSNMYSNEPPMIPQAPPPITSNPSFLPPPYAARGQVPQSYINLPPRRFAGQNGAPNLGMGLGAGALAAGTLIFGENLLPGPSFAAGLDPASIIVSSDPAF